MPFSGARKMFEAAGQADTLRLLLFVGAFAVMATWEAIAPFRTRGLPHWLRWGSNLGLLFIGNMMLRLIVPVTAVGFAAITQEAGWGLLNLVDLPVAVAFLVGVALLDMGIYAQHRLFHVVPLLWNVHRVHHADTEFDVSTALRFHPFEMGLSLLFKLAMIALLGPSPAAVFTFEVVLNAGAMFNHANIALPAGIERMLRLFIVTPGMHRIHHSMAPAETNSNYGFSLSLWDRMFGSYCERSEAPQSTMPIGLSHFRDTRDAWLDRLLVLPFSREKGGG